VKFVFRMMLAATNTKDGRCLCGNDKTGFVVFAMNLFRWLNAHLSMPKEEQVDVKTRGLSMNAVNHVIRSVISGVTPRRVQSIFSRPSLAVLILLLSSSAISLAQTGFAVSGQAITPGGTPASGARITVCPYTASGIPCSPPSSIYSNIDLTGSPLPQPYAADQHGNYTFYVAPYSSYLVQIAVNQTTTYSYVFTAAAANGTAFNLLACVDSSGSPTAYVCSTNPTITVAVNTTIIFNAGTTSGASPTLAVNGSAAANIVTAAGVNIAAGQITANQPVILVYSGSSWVASSGLGTVSGQVAQAVPLSTVGGTTINAASNISQNSGTGSIAVNLSGVSLPTLPVNTDFSVFGVSGLPARSLIANYGGASYFSTLTYGGTASSPTAVASGQELGGNNSWAYDGTATGGPAASFRAYANQTWSVGNHGTYADIATTPNGSTSEAEVLKFGADGGITTPGLTDQGAGTLNAGALYATGTSSTVSLGNSGGIYQNMGTTANEQTLWGSRVGIAIPVPYVMPTGSAKNIAFDVVPLAGATNFGGNTGVAWTDICDGNFATACNQPGTVNYETIRLGIYATGDGFLSSEAGGTGTIHNLLLQNTLGNVMIGSAGSNEPAFSLVIAEPTNPAIELANQTLTSTNYVAMPTASNAFIVGSVSGDFAFRGGGGNLLFGSNSSAPGPTLEITPGSPGTVESFGNVLITDSHGSGSSQTNGASACSTTPTNFGTTSVNTGSATTSTVLSCLPANSVIDAITYRVTTAITTATSFTVGDSGSATRYSTCYFSGGAQALTLGATGVCNAGYYQIGGAALPVQLTFNATPGAGALRIIVYYHTWVPPQS
jgi:hypothetical protein